MYQKKKIAVIIAAAGSGSRMGGGICKQFRKLGELPVLTRAVRAFDVHPFIDEIVVVTREESLEFCREEMIAPYGLAKVRAVIAGGATRQDSVYRGLLSLSRDADLALVHDGARPFVSAGVIARTVETACQRGAAVAAVPVKDTIKTIAFESCGQEGAASEAAGYFIHTPERSALYAVQTPQGFSVPLLREAMERAFAENFYGTDDSVLVERLHKRVYLVKSEYENIKITTAEDLVSGEAIAARLDAGERSSKESSMEGNSVPAMRVGTGFDVHRLTEGRKLILGGVEIPWEKGLLGHSDADVLVHAAMDALLGAAALGDIGKHFPDSDEAYRGVSSISLLEAVGRLLDREGYAIGNLDAVVIAQQPRIAPYIPEMREKMAAALAVDRERISIKGTTTEGLGYAGRGEGIAASAVALLLPAPSAVAKRTDITRKERV